MDAALPQIIIGILSLATAVTVFITTQSKFIRRKAPSDIPEDSYGTVLQSAIDRIEQLEKENARLRSSQARYRRQLAECVRSKRRNGGTYRGDSY